MRYYVSLDPAKADQPTVIDVTELPTGQLEVKIGDRLVPIDAVWLDNGVASIRVGGRIVDLTVEGQPPEIGAIASGHRSYVRVESERQRAAAAARKGGATGGERIVKSPMPGRVVRVLVKADPDTEIAAGTTLCVIEAMKMENEVKAKAPCKVIEVHAKEGATVEGGAKLFTLG